MIRRQSVLVLIALLIATAAFAQGVSIQGSNEMRWADGRETLGGQEQAKRYFENRLNTDLYYGQIRIGARLTVLQPSEFGETKYGPETLDKRFLEYSDPDINFRLRAGDFYTVWGRGLTLALVEDINQGFDSGLDGVMATGGFGNIEMEAIAGRSKEGYLGLVRESQVSGGHIGASLPAGLGVGGQALLVTPVEDPTISSYDENRTFGGYLSWDGNSMSIWAEHAIESIEGIDDDHDASYLSVSWFGNRLGVVLDYKRYRYYRFASGLSGAGSTYAQSVGILPFHNAPIGQREFTSPLFSKHPHIVLFNDEVGVQAEVTYNPTNDVTFILAMSQSSSFVERDGWLPSLEEEQSPFREVFLEMNAYPSASWYATAWTGWNEDLVYHAESNTRVDWKRQAVLGTQNEVRVSGDWSVKSIVEGVNVSEVTTDESYMDGLLVLGATWNSQYTASVTYEFTGEENPANDVSSWVKAEFGAFLANRHELLLTVGQERGGLVCSSGKCRVVTPFNGVKMTLTTLF